MVFDPEAWAEIVERDVAIVDQYEGNDWSPHEVDAYEQALGFELPAGYRWLLENHPGVVLSNRWLWRGGSDYPLSVSSMPLWGPYLGDYYIESFLTGDGISEEVFAWDRELHRCLLGRATESSTAVLALDFTFDPVDPPVVALEVGTDWDLDVWAAGNRGRLLSSHGKVSFVADDFDAFFEAPQVVDERPLGVPVEPTREQEWGEWRNARLREWGAEWFREEQIRRERLANPTLEDLEERVAQARRFVDDGGHAGTLGYLGLRLKRLGERTGNPEHFAEAIEWFERGADAGDETAVFNLEQLRRQQNIPPTRPAS